MGSSVIVDISGCVRVNAGSPVGSTERDKAGLMKKHYSKQRSLKLTLFTDGANYLSLT